VIEEPAVLVAGKDVGHVEDLRPLPTREAEEDSSRCETYSLSTLAEAVRDYLDRNPHDACQKPQWIAITLWCLDLYDGKPGREEIEQVLEELGGERYRCELLERSREAV
jgi:hypothetical protein